MHIFHTYHKNDASSTYLTDPPPHRGVSTPRFTEQIRLNVKLRDSIDNFSKQILDEMVKQGIPALPENVDKVFEWLNLHLGVDVAQMVINDAKEEFKMVKVDVGETIRTVETARKVYSARVVSVGHIAGFQNWDIDPLVSCVNPFCNQRNQFLTEDREGSAMWYCPKCKVLYRWDWKLKSEDLK